MKTNSSPSATASDLAADARSRRRESALISGAEEVRRLTSAATSARAALVLLLLSAVLSPLSTFGQSTAFTFQGFLTDQGAPASGAYDLTFTLFNASGGGATVGASNVVNDLAITNGLFTVTLDYGSVSFDGTDRWLQTAARPGASLGAFTNLTPRQAVTPSPYAIFAGGINASGIIGSLPSANLSGTYSNTVTLNNAANSFSGAFTGNGGGLTNLNASNLASGTVPSARLSGTYTSPVTISNAVNNFAGNGSGLTTLNASQLTFGTVPLGALNNAWKIFGNTGTSPGADNFVGTLDNQPLELRVNSSRALRLEPNATSPNLIGGHSNNSSGVSFGVAIGGGGNFTDPNTALGSYSVIGGGLGNMAAELATVSGGASNLAGGIFSVIAGGTNNLASGDFSVVSGGMLNSATTNFAVVSGGTNNMAGGYASVVSGGLLNMATTNFTTVSGGRSNVASGLAAVVGGGETNRAIQPYTTVGGGQNNTAINNHATVGGGVGNLASGVFSTVAGGRENIASFTGATVGGGFNNLASNLFATVGGGHLNKSLLPDTTIGGGFNNLASANFATVGGGNASIASGTNSTVGGGQNNLASETSATVGGGSKNSATNEFATVGGGLAGIAGGTNSTVGGGLTNLALAAYATIPGGKQARADQYGQMANASGAFEKSGDAQHSVFVLRAVTTNSFTPVDLALDGGTNKLKISTNRTMTFDILLTARADPSSDSAGYQIRGVVKEVGGLATFVGGTPPIATLGQDPVPWIVSISIFGDELVVTVNNNGYFANVRWVARVDTAEVTW